MQEITKIVKIMSAAIFLAALMVMFAPTMALAQSAPSPGASLPPGTTLPPSASAYCSSGGITLGNLLATPLTLIAKAVDSATSSIYTNSGALAKQLLVGLGTLEFLWFTYTTVWKRTEMIEIFTTQFFKIISLSVLMAFIVGISANNGLLVKQVVFGSFSAMATSVTATGTTPVFVFDTSSSGSAVSAPLQNLAQQATCNAYLIISFPADQAAKLQQALPAGNITNGFNLGANIQILGQWIVATFMAFGAGTMVLLLYGAIGIFMLILIIDGTLMLGVSIFVLGFSGSRWTSGMGTGYFKYVIAMGFKVFAVQFVGGIITLYISQTITGAIATTVTTGAPYLDLMSIVSIYFGCFIGAVMLLNVNKIADTIASGTPSFGMTGAMVEGMATAAVVGGGAALAAKSMMTGGGGIKAMETLANSKTQLAGGGGGPGGGGKSSAPTPPKGSAGSSVMPPSGTSGAGASSGPVDSYELAMAAMGKEPSRAATTSGGSSNGSSSGGAGSGGTSNGSSGGNSQNGSSGGSQSGSSRGTGRQQSEERGAAKRIRQASNIVSGMFHSNPILSETDEDKNDPKYQMYKHGMATFNALNKAATTHTGGASHGFQTPRMHGGEG